VGAGERAGRLPGACSGWHSFGAGFAWRDEHDAAIGAVVDGLVEAARGEGTGSGAAPMTGVRDQPGGRCGMIRRTERATHNKDQLTPLLADSGLNQLPLAMLVTI